MAKLPDYLAKHQLTLAKHRSAYGGTMFPRLNFHAQASAADAKKARMSDNYKFAEVDPTFKHTLGYYEQLAQVYANEASGEMGFFKGDLLATATGAGYLADKPATPIGHPISPKTLTEARTRAIHKLWKGVLDDTLVRHPNGVIQFWLKTPDKYDSYHYGNATSKAVSGKIRLGIPDTRNDVRKPYDDHVNFHTPFKVNCWPGEKLAAIWVVAAYTIYMVHEASELVHSKKALTTKDGRSDWESRHYQYPGVTRVYDVHDLYNYPGAKQHHWSMFDALDNGDLPTVVKHLMGQEAFEELQGRTKGAANTQLQFTTDEELTKYNETWATYPRAPDNNTYNFRVGFYGEAR